MPAPDLSLVIVSFNTRELLDRCLAALPAAAPGRSLQVVVVDNASGDGSAAMVRARHAAVELLETGGPVGSARAHNLGLARAAGRTQVWLNPDCVARPGSLAALADHLGRHPECGAVGPRLVHADGRPQPSAQAFPGLTRVLAHFLGLRALLRGPLAPVARALGRAAGGQARAYVDALDAGGAARRVDWVTGACLATRADVAARAGPLDEGYFMYCEDTDWCQRVHALGLEVHLLPGAVVEHHVGASASANPTVAFHHYRSLLRYFRRHRPRSAWAIRAVMGGAFVLRGAGRELARLGGHAAPHPWWRLAALAWTGGE